MKYILYSAAGKIMQLGETVQDIVIQEYDGVTAMGVSDSISVSDLVEKYVLNCQLADRPEMQIILNSASDNNNIPANGTDTTTLSNLPDPCTITYTGPGFTQASEVTGGIAEFTTDVAGTHTVKVVAFPYLDWEGTFDAV